jgi:4-methylaminobutanoate oxidase (formaldehyde-forming)
MTAVLSLMGPNARALLGRVGAADTFAALAPEQLRFATTREIDLGFARVRAARMSYVGGPGFELSVPIEMARHVWLALHEASEGLGIDGGGLADAGYYALDALRIEAGRRAWGAELGPDDTPFEAGTMFAVKLAKRDDFIGKAALVRMKDEPLRKKLVTVVLATGDAWVWGGEALLVDGVAVGEISSAGWSDAAGRCVALGYVRGEAATRAHAGGAITVDLWGDAIAASTWDSWNPAISAAPRSR